MSKYKVGEIMGFTYDTKTGEWSRVHRPGDPVVMGHGDVGFSLAARTMDGDTLVAVEVNMHGMPPDPERKAGDVIADDIVMADHPVLGTMRFLNAESAQVMKNIMDVVIGEFEKKKASEDL